MHSTSRLITISLFAAMVTAGCARVNPASDLADARRRAADAVGTHADAPPDDEAARRTFVANRRAEGLSCDNAVRIALWNNPAIESALRDVGMARADLVQAGLLSNPTLGISARLPSGGGLSNIEASIAQSIAELWQIAPRRSAAQGTLDRVILETAQRISTIVIDTRRAYYRALGTDALHTIANENQRTANEFLEIAIGRLDLGAGTEVEVNLARAAVLEADLSQRTTRFDMAQARRDLAAMLGLEDDLSADTLTDKWPAVTALTVVSEELLIRAAEHRLDLQAGMRRVDAADAELLLQRRRVFKNLSLGLSLERGERKAQPGHRLLANTLKSSLRAGQLTAPEIQTRSERIQHTDFIIGPTLSIELPIFDQNQAQIARARYAYEQAALEFRSLTLQVLQRVRTAADRLNTQAQLAALYRDQFQPLAERNLEMARESYRSGKTSFLSVLEAQRFLLTTRSRTVAAAMDYALTIPALESEIGLPIDQIRATSVEPNDPNETEVDDHD